MAELTFETRLSNGSRMSTTMDEASLEERTVVLSQQAHSALSTLAFDLDDNVGPDDVDFDAFASWVIEEALDSWLTQNPAFFHELWRKAAKG